MFYKKNKSAIDLHVIPVMKCGCMFWEFAKRKFGTENDNIKIIKTKRDSYATCLPLTLSLSCLERCEVLACFYIIVKMYRYSLEERVFIVKTYWITGSIKNCQRKFVEQFGGRNQPSKRCIQLLVEKLETKETWRRHEVANRLLASPRKSLRVLLQEIGLSRSTCQRAAKKAGLHAYQFTVVQELKQPARLR
jgi:hypothetical protein